MCCAAQFEIWSALQLGVPMITVMIPGAYNFAQANEAFADLPRALNVGTARTRKNEPSSPWKRNVASETSPSERNIKAELLSKRSASNRSERSWREPDSTTPSALTALKARLPSGTDVTAVGKLIHERCARSSTSKPVA